MSAQCPPPKAKKLSAWSRVLRRGAIGRSIDGRSTEGRFLRDFEAQLTAHIGGEASAVETILISRAARTALRLMLLEEKMDGGSTTDLDLRTHAGLQTALTRMLDQLGLKAAKAKLPGTALREYLNGAKK